MERKHVTGSMALLTANYSSKTCDGRKASTTGVRTGLRAQERHILKNHLELPHPTLVAIVNLYTCSESYIITTITILFGWSITLTRVRAQFTSVFSKDNSPCRPVPDSAAAPD